MGLIRSFRQHAAKTFDLPEDVMNDWPSVNLIGQSQAYIENYIRLHTFQLDLIEIETTIGMLVVEGSSFELHTTERSGFMIKGEIHRLFFRIMGGAT